MPFKHVLVVLFLGYTCHSSMFELFFKTILENKFWKVSVFSFYLKVILII